MRFDFTNTGSLPGVRNLEFLAPCPCCQKISPLARNSCTRVAEPRSVFVWNRLAQEVHKSWTTAPLLDHSTQHAVKRIQLLIPLSERSQDDHAWRSCRYQDVPVVTISMARTEMISPYVRTLHLPTDCAARRAAVQLRKMAMPVKLLRSDTAIRAPGIAAASHHLVFSRSICQLSCSPTGGVAGPVRS